MKRCLDSWDTKIILKAVIEMAIKKEILIDQYVNALDQEKIPWERGWSVPHNPITGTEYSGFNQLWLAWVSDFKSYTDTRWYTFNEIIDRNGKYHPGETWKLKKGSEGVEISNRPCYYNKAEDKFYSSKVYFKKLASLNDEEKQLFKDECKKIWNKKDIVYIYNASDIEGIPPKEKPEIKAINEELVKRIISNVGVEYQEVNQNSSYYDPKKDMIVLPPKERFKDEGMYFSTLLHELSHATGHQSRLNRDLSGGKGSMEYAREELVADIGSAFLMADFGLQFDEEHLKRHLAYIQSWSELLKKDKTVLYEAVKEAELINDYIKKMSIGNTIEIGKDMDDLLLEGKNKYIEIHPSDEEISYSVFDKDFLLLDGGVLEINEKITANDFLEIINTDQLKLNVNELYTESNMSSDQFYEQVDKKIQRGKSAHTENSHISNNTISANKSAIKKRGRGL